MDNFHGAAEGIEINVQSAQVKAGLSLRRMIVLGILAGAFIALGGAASSTAAFGIDNTGIQRLVTGVVFPVGLMMTVFSGAELFTGNCLIEIAVLEKKINAKQLIRNLAVVYFSNLLGALLIDVLLFFSGNLDLGNGLLGAYAIKLAVSKVSISPVKALASGILCNVLVCVAILMAASATDAIGKLFSAFFPIFGFVICGFEHCVANMFYIPIGILASTNSYYVMLAENYSLTAEQIESSLTVLNSLRNFIPVTIGNLIGGLVLVSLPCYLVQKKWKEEDR
ncbi:MAG: formate/nitrite transporter family protein [Lachnospiraceae bacterium]|nr:formate/nitrite transporter family protein [Lachnospiraceae bacterium]